MYLYINLKSFGVIVDSDFKLYHSNIHLFKVSGSEGQFQVYGRHLILIPSLCLLKWTAEIYGGIIYLAEEARNIFKVAPGWERRSDSRDTNIVC